MQTVKNRADFGGRGTKRQAVSATPAVNMDDNILREFLDEPVIPFKAKMDDFLPVVLGVRKAAQIVMPAELPDAGILGATIDDRFRSKMEGRRIPGESFGNFLKGKTGKFWRRNQMQDLRFRLEVLRDLYTDIVEGSQSYKVYMGWIDKLGLYKKELESRPTIREIYIFKDPSVSVELGELQDIRKDVRYASMKAPDPSIPVSLRAFPEERSTSYMKKLASILGFPICCADRYVFDRSSGVLSPEVRASNQILHSESPEEVNNLAYFTKDFFPCQPDCEEAAEIGRTIYEKIRELNPELADRYLEHVAENARMVRQYPEIIQQRIASLEQQAGVGEGDQVEKDE